MKKDLTQEEIPVWVVDDDEVRYSIRFALATHGIDARTYASGEDFFNLVETDQPGCLVVDLTMPGMSGIEVLKRLRDLDSPIKGHRAFRPRHYPHGRRSHGERRDLLHGEARRSRRPSREDQRRTRRLPSRGLQDARAHMLPPVLQARDTDLRSGLSGPEERRDRQSSFFRRERSNLTAPTSRSALKTARRSASSTNSRAPNSTRAPCSSASSSPPAVSRARRAKRKSEKKAKEKTED